QNHFFLACQPVNILYTNIFMEKQPTVVFRNVGQLYFPQTRVECHYSLEPDHQWTSSDWVGIFQQEGSSVNQYHTYTWALVPEGHTDGSSTNCCVVFRASYLPQPSAARYEFRYVDKAGQVCARSRPFLFCLPKPLGELETLKDEENEEDGEEELLLVVPRAQLLQSRLDQCLRKQEEVQRGAGHAMREVISQLTDGMKEKCEKVEEMEGRHKIVFVFRQPCQDVTHRHDDLTGELASLMAQRTQSQQQIRDLEDENKALRETEREGTMEVDRQESHAGLLKERLKKMSNQMKHDEVEAEASLQEARGLQERLEASEHLAEDLRRELRELGAGQYAHTELHQARLQVAQLTLQLSEENLLLREERANWALEREAYKHAAESDKMKMQELSCEVQRKEEWLQEERREREKLEAQLESEQECNRVLSDARRDLLELQSSLRRVQRDKEQ
uniref:Calcium binding and coiled-coil domain 1b n=1 Tax=Tetraodon nigroviridis TaxID=99883 RepID=H3C1W6_TETNG